MGKEHGSGSYEKIIPWIIASAVIMLALPWRVVTFIKGDGGMVATHKTVSTNKLK